MGVICFHRAIEDWSKKTGLDEMRGILSGVDLKMYLRSKEEWDNCMSMTLFEFRHRIQQIHLKSVRVAQMEMQDDLKVILQNADDNDVVVPSDDDDFYRPDICDFLHDVPDGIFAWNYLGMTAGVKHVGYNKVNTKICLISCGYAANVKWLRSLEFREAYDLMMWHWLPHEHVTKTCPTDLSFYNYHYGATSRLRKRKFEKTQTSVWPMCRQYWAYPYLRDLYHVYQEAGFFRIKLT